MRQRVGRFVVGRFRVDVLVEPCSHDEDRVLVHAREGGLDFVLADGAGNSETLAIRAALAGDARL